MTVNCNELYGGGDDELCRTPVTTTTSQPHVGTAVSANVNGLPFTGGDVLGLSGIGLGFILIGTALARRARR